MNTAFSICLTVTVSICYFISPVHADPFRANSLPDTQLNGSNQAGENARRFLDDPLKGVIVNRTVTVFGNDFYQYFSANWRERADMTDFTISIHERPSARFGSEIWVEFNQKQMFHAFLSPARSAVKEISQQAAEIVYQNISRSEIERAMFQSADLGPEEL